MDNRPAGIKDCRLGSRLDFTGFGGAALHAWWYDLPVGLRRLLAAASPDSRAAQTLAVAEPTTAGPATGDPKLGRTRGYRLAGGRPAVVEFGKRGLGTWRRFQVPSTLQDPAPAESGTQNIRIEEQ